MKGTVDSLAKWPGACRPYSRTDSIDICITHQWQKRSEGSCAIARSTVTLMMSIARTGLSLARSIGRRKADINPVEDGERLLVPD